MKHLIFFICILGLGLSGVAQNAQTPQEAARAFMRSGDFDNAILVLSKAIQQEPANLDLQKDLALSYYYKRDYARALNQVKPMLDRDDADVVTYQIGGNIYKALEEVKDADKMYKKAIKKFPGSGALYSEYGELLWEKRDEAAIRYWEKGIQSDPSYAGNYYNAALFYANTNDRIWTVIYGEIFVNMEYLTDRAASMKKVLLDNYKTKLFVPLGKDEKYRSEFAKAVSQTFMKQASQINMGITTETLTRIRTRFLLDWFSTYAAKFPFKLFDYQQQLVKSGMFEAYNEWLFGAVDNLSAFDQWSKTNADAYSKFSTFQKSRIFKMPQGQYYQVLPKE